MPPPADQQSEKPPHDSGTGSGSDKFSAAFPDVEAKLARAPKQSAFEKQKAFAEAKRRREAAETAAVYESFVKSFDNEAEDDGDEISAIARGGRSGLGGAGAPKGPPGKRHYGTGAGPGMSKSGPGSLGPAPTGYGKGKGFDRGGVGSARREEARRDEDSLNRGPGIRKAFDTGSDDEKGETTGRGGVDRAEERAVAKPTLRLANLPLGTSPAVIKALIPDKVAVENVKMLPAAAATTSSNERKSMAAIVVLSQETPASDMDAVVSMLQNRYLGYGYYLSLHRHLSSAVTASNNATLSSLPGVTGNSTSHSQPFGAKPVSKPTKDHHHHNPRSFAPPSSYGPPMGGGGASFNRGALLAVPVRPPGDIKQLRLIHATIEAVLQHGPEFEALVMTRPEVQREEKWAWIWDARSAGGVWYRWRLWGLVTGGSGNLAGGRRGGGKYVPLFDGGHAWKTPGRPLAYEYATRIDEFVSDPEYDSDVSDDDFGDNGAPDRESGAGTGTGPNNENEEPTYLNPLDRARLVHLLARLPTTLTRIRKGDVARLTAFAVAHASRGADEVVDLVVSNVLRPLTLSGANPDYDKSNAAAKPSSPPENNNADPIDTSAASLVGLYVVSDILSASATSGVRHGWRFRPLFEAALRQRRVFEKLGATADRLGWGRLRADKWRRSVGLVLSLWEGWCVFPSDTHEHFVKVFENSPLIEKKEEGAEESEQAEKKKGWKTVEGKEEKRGFKPVAREEKGYDPGAEADEMEIDGEVDDGEAMDEDEEEEEALMDEDIDGVPMSEDELGELGVLDQRDGDEEKTKLEEVAREDGKGKPRKRMCAVDLFADKDGDGGAGD